MNKTKFLGYASRLETNSLVRWLDRIIDILRAEGEKERAVRVLLPLPLLDDKH
jgi:hypothetical protein